MNIDYLHEFTELAKRLNFTETARYLNMSQPTLSKHINQLEKELRLSLFDRVGNSLRLTKTGMALLPYAYQITDAQSDFNSKVAELRKAAPQRLTISGLTDEGPSTEILGFLISLLSPQYGASFLEVKSRYNKDAREMLGSNTVDIMFDPAPAEETLNEDFIETLHIADLPLIAIMSSDHPLAQRESISLGDLSGETFLKYEGLYLARSWSYTEKACRNHGFTPKIKSYYCASLPELFAACADLKSSVLLIGCNFGDKIPVGLKSFCKVVPIVDEDAVIPFYFLFRKDNDNPVLKDAIEHFRQMPNLPFRFS